MQNFVSPKFLVSLHVICRINVSGYREQLWKLSLQKHVVKNLKKVNELAYI